MKAPFPIQPELTAIAIAYRNKQLIADDVLPRVPVGKAEFKYLKHRIAEGFTVPDTKVGRKSKPNEVEFGADELTASTEDFGLDDPVPQADIDNAPPNFDPLGNAVMKTADLLALDREVRVAGLVFDANQYAAANKVTLAGGDQWSDFVNSDPLDDIMLALDTPVIRPNVCVMGRAVWSKLAQHPKINKAVHGTAGDVGIAARRAVADLFELEDILVGEGWLNTAKKGQPVALSRVWGKHALFFYRNRVADAQGGGTFGLTAQFGTRIAGADPDKNIGLRGGQRVRVGESVKELITAADFGYFIQNAVA
jgi:hypothetical protein